MLSPAAAPFARVAITRTQEQRCASDLAALLSASGIDQRLPSQGLVLVKPNFVTDKADYIARGANTSQQLLAGVLGILRDHRCRVVIGESQTGTSVKGRRLTNTWQAMGLPDLAQRFGAELVNLTQTPVVFTRFSGRGLPGLLLPRIVHDADLLVNLPKIKTHKYAALTCAMKNLFGLVPNPRRIVYHRWLAEILVDLCCLVEDRSLVIVDGLVGMEGNGPLYGDPVSLNLLLAGDSNLAVDRVVAHLIGLDPWRIPYLEQAFLAGLAGPVHLSRLNQAPLRLPQPFQPVHHNPYRWFEKKLMESPWVEIVTSAWFQRHCSSHLAWLTQYLRGGGYRWYLDDDPSPPRKSSR